MSLTKTKKSVIDVSTIIGGTDGQLQFNSGTDFAGSADLTWDNINKVLSSKGLTIDNIKISPMTGSKNYLINGAFDVWQRGTSLINTTTEGLEYVTDRWYYQMHNDSGVIDGKLCSRMDFPTFSTAGTSNASYTYPNIIDNATGEELDDPRYFIKFGGYVDSPLGGNDWCNLVQPIEDVTILAGKTVTCSFWAKGSSSGVIGVGLQQRFIEREDTADSSSPVWTLLGDIDVTTDWKLHTLTATLPSIKNKTLVDNEHYTALMFHTDRGTSITANIGGSQNIKYQGEVSLAHVQLEEGTRATSFEKKMKHKELSQCYRYYEEAICHGMKHPSGDDTGGWVYFTDKRTLPDVTYHHPDTDELNHYKYYYYSGGPQVTDQDGVGYFELYKITDKSILVGVHNKIFPINDGFLEVRLKISAEFWE